MINARLRPPPQELINPAMNHPIDAQQSMLHPQTNAQPQSMLLPQMTQQTNDQHARSQTVDPVVKRLVGEAQSSSMIDVHTLEEQLQLPASPKFVDLLGRARKFDGPSSQVGGTHAHIQRRWVPFTRLRCHTSPNARTSRPTIPAFAERTYRIISRNETRGQYFREGF